MIKVHLSEIAPTGGYSEIVEMEAVPREGDGLWLNEDGPVFTVRAVIWMIGDAADAYDVQVRFR